MQKILINEEHGLVLLHNSIVDDLAAVLADDPRRFNATQAEWSQGVAILEDDSPLNRSLYDRITSELLEEMI